MHKLINRSFVAIGVTIIPVVLKYLIQHLYKNKSKKLQELKSELDNSYYHCIFWTMRNIPCAEHMYINTECGDNCSVRYLNTLLKLLASAKYSISMCMYHLTLRQITDELMKAQKRGVDVRIITDLTTSKMEHSKIKLLKERYGFQVRTPPYEDSYMHHKYCVIDSKDPELQKMFLGSLNLTLQGCVKNFEFVTITNNPSIIQRYNEEFESLWDTFQN